MPSPQDLKEIFGKFTGKPLKDPERVTTDIDDVLGDMKSAAIEMGLRLRVVYPGRNADFGHNPNRITIFAEQDEKGSFRVGDKFTIG